MSFDKELIVNSNDMVMKQVGELIKERYGFILLDPRYTDAVERGKKKFQREDENPKKKRRGGFKKTFKEYLGIGTQQKLFE